MLTKLQIIQLMAQRKRPRCRTSTRRHSADGWNKCGWERTAWSCSALRLEWSKCSALRLDILNWSSNCVGMDIQIALQVAWPRVPSDRCVVFSVAQYPDEAHGAKVDDAEGLLKLASEQCANCLNPYHITLDCAHRRPVLNRQWWVTLLQSTIRHWW